MHIRAQLIVPDNRGIRIFSFQLFEQGRQRGVLGMGAGIRRDALFVQAALVTDADRMQIETFGMRADVGDRATMMEHPVTGNVKMITDAGEAALTVTLF